MTEPPWAPNAIPSAFLDRSPPSLLDPNFNIPKDLNLSQLQIQNTKLPAGPHLLPYLSSPPNFLKGNLCFAVLFPYLC